MLEKEVGIKLYMGSNIPVFYLYSQDPASFFDIGSLSDPYMFSIVAAAANVSEGIFCADRIFKEQN